jgi:hypothetical protein
MLSLAAACLDVGLVLINLQPGSPTHRIFPCFSISKSIIALGLFNVTMYQPPQTFLWEDSPPSSPHDVKLPTFQISSPAPQDDKAKEKHKRWKSHSEKSKAKHPPPFSYEYRICDGQIAGLAEYNGANDYLHYSSSSRGSSRVPSRNASTNASPRTSTVEGQSNESDRSMQPPPSPRKSDKLKRALSLSNVKGRSSLEDKKRRAPPVPSPPKMSTPTFEKSELQAPMDISQAFGPTPPRSPRRSFEEPRPAPSPPSKNRSDAARQLMGPPTPKQSFEEPRSILKQSAPQASTNTALSPQVRSFEGPRNRPTVITSMTPSSQVAQVVTSATEVQSAPRPPLRRKTSKFVEHIDTAPPKEEVTSAATPPLPSLPPFDFQLPASPEKDMLKRSTPIRRAATTARKPSQKITHLEWTQPIAPKPELRPQTKLQKSQPALTSAQKAQPLQPLEHHITRKLSTSNVKSSATRVPVPAAVLKRAASMRTRPPTVWGDLCMAEVKPVLTSPIVASGHARMVSC